MYAFRYANSFDHAAQSDRRAGSGLLQTRPNVGRAAGCPDAAKVVMGGGPALGPWIPVFTGNDG